MKNTLVGERVAVLVANGFCEKDLVCMQKSLVAQGAQLSIVSMNAGMVSSWAEEGWGLNFAADQMLNNALAADYDILIIPGGERGIEKLKLTGHTGRFIRGFADSGKPVVAFGAAGIFLDFVDGAPANMLAGQSEDEESRLAFSKEVMAFLIEKPYLDGNAVAEAVAA